MDLSVDEIKTEIRGNLGNRTDLDDRLEIFINLAQLRISRVNDFDYLNRTNSGTTTADVGSQAVPVDEIDTGLKVRNIKHIVLRTGNGRSHTVTGLSYKEFDRRFPEPDYFSKALPEFYMVFPKDDTHNIQWYRVPDDAYDFICRYNVWPRKIGSGPGQVDGSNNLDIKYVDDLVINLSTSIAFQSLQREDKSMEYFKIYSTMVRESQDMKFEDFDTTMAGVKPMEGYVGSDLTNDPFIKGTV